MRLQAAVALLLVAATAVGCSGGDEPSAGPTPSASSSSAAPTPSKPPTARPAPTPPARGCYRLDYDAAVAPTAQGRPVACTKPHTSVTYAVGELDTVLDGHLLAVDSARVQQQAAADCPARFGAYVGGSTEDQRLTMLRPVWFTPTVAQSDAGARWYRCDVVAIAGDEQLAPLAGSLAGVLDTGDGRERYAMCGTASPSTKGFERVICSQPHAWRAIAVVPLPDGPYPGVDQVRAAGQSPCQDAGASVASDTLDYQWGYEWPTARQWAQGQHYGRCWAPD